MPPKINGRLVAAPPPTRKMAMAFGQGILQLAFIQGREHATMINPMKAYASQAG